MRQKLRGHRGYLRIPCCCRSVVLIGLPKVKFLVWASGGSDKNREGGKQMIDAREEGKKGVYMAPSSAPRNTAPRCHAAQTRCLMWRLTSQKARRRRSWRRPRRHGSRRRGNLWRRARRHISPLLSELLSFVFPLLDFYQNLHSSKREI